MTQIGIAFELDWLNEPEQVAARQLHELIAQRDAVDHVRELRAAIEAIIEPAGLVCGAGGEHLFICRKTCQDTEFAKPERPHFPDQERGKYRDVMNIPRWAFIGSITMAAAWLIKSYGDPRKLPELEEIALKERRRTGGRRRNTQTTETPANDSAKNN